MFEILDSMGDQITILDLEGKIIAENKALRDFTIDNGGISQIGKNYIDICRNVRGNPDAMNYSVSFIENFNNAISSRKKVKEIEFPCHYFKEGKIRWFRQYIEPGNGFVLIRHNDITSFKLKEISDDNFRSMLLHDLKNPIGAINMAYEMFEHKIYDYETLFNRVKEGKLKIEDIISSSMVFIDPENLKGFDLFDLKEEISKIMAFQEIVYGKRDLVFKNGSNLINPRISCLKGPMRSVFDNILKNAYEASPIESTITINYDLSDYNHRISINNQGVIPENIRKDFFKKGNTSGKKNGSGLGTYLAKTFIEMHNGYICFDSNEDNGTTIYIQIPIIED